MPQTLRACIVLLLMMALAAMLLWGWSGVPSSDAPLPPIADYYNEAAPRVVGAANVVSAINFGFRAYDTIGEATILLTAVTGVSVLLRTYQQRRRATGEA
ncbi:MAG: hydrogen gas-evolving membrane-bound hydrogenase subunit E [Ardenticatenaceae bacterium]